MKWQKNNLFWLFFITVFIFLYYVWIITWKNDQVMLTWGGNVFSIAGSLIGAVWLAAAFKRSKQSEKLFWLFLSLGCQSYVLAELLWIYQENILEIEPPYPGFSDLFYIMQMVFFLAAFMYKLTKEKRNYQLVRLLFDISIVMTVAFTFSWQFIILPIVLMPGVSHFSLLVSLTYSLGDLVLLLSAVSIYFGNRQTFSNKAALFIFLGLMTHVFADTIFLYLISIDEYSSGSLVDPLFILGLLFVGFTGILQKTASPENQVKKEKEVAVQKLDVLRLSLPYVNVAILFIFMILRSNEMDALMIGSGISILLVITRQILMILENQQLLHTLSKKAEELEISEQRYKSLFEYHPDAVYSLDLKGKFESVNTAGADLLGYEKKELAGLSLSSLDVSMPDNQQKTGEEYLSKVMEAKSQSYEVSFCNKAGKFYYMNVTNIPIIVKNKVVGIFGIGKDITENKKNEEKIKYLAYHDSLTGLFNRAYFEEGLKQWTAAAEQNNEMFAVMFLDLDRFKNINDTLGHDTGDQLLISVAKRLKECVQEEDIVARQGGDEFTLIIKGISNRADAEQAAQKVLDSLNKPYHIKGHEIVSTSSIGIAVYPLNDTTPVNLMKKADRAMYEVKENGKGHYKLYGESRMTNISS